ncbi:hypothetical protein [Thauera phenylacetica]|uniref:phage tail terminator protein n=1 Tax=Thauera phenylacetica TaxID=164400 RepID=UPI0039E713AE
MKLDPIVQALRARCPSFAGRVAGAAEFKGLPESAALPVPAAFVIPLDDNPSENRSQTGYRQALRESVAVVVALSNTADERGQASGNAVHDIRAELWKALLGWSPVEDCDGLEYEGGQLLAMDRARLWYQFEFAADIEIGSDDVGNPETWQAQELAALPMLEHVHFTLDAIDPRDPNVAGTGPDGKPEAVAAIDIPTT